MKLKYYLRGLGIGIAVTAILMGIALSGKKETLTDEQIRERALKLGMIDGSETLAALENEGEEDELALEDTMGGVSENQFVDLSDTEGQHQDESPESEDSSNVEQDEETNEKSDEKPLTEEELANENVTVEEADKTVADNKPAENTKPVENTTSAENTTPAGNQSRPREEIVVITVYSGEGSGVVANKLKNAGLIDDASDFDRFLCQNGYDKRLSTGDHDIVVGSSYREMAEALVKRKN